jgi:hypothetical protein
LGTVGTAYSQSIDDFLVFPQQGRMLAFDVRGALVGTQQLVPVRAQPGYMGGQFWPVASTQFERLHLARRRGQ